MIETGIVWSINSTFPAHPSLNVFNILISTAHFVQFHDCILYSCDIMVVTKIYPEMAKILAIPSNSIPDSATIEMSTPNSYDMKPRTEKTAKPATMLVTLFSMHKANVSLELEKIIMRCIMHHSKM